MFPLKSSYNQRFLIISERIKGNRFAQIHSVFIGKLSKDPLESILKTIGIYRIPVIWKIELFESIINSFQLLTIVTKSSIQQGVISVLELTITTSEQRQLMHSVFAGNLKQVLLLIIVSLLLPLSR